MKKSRQAKNQSANNPDAPNAATVPQGRWPLPRWIVLGLCLLLAAGGTWAFFEFVIWNKVPSELVGKWVVMEGPDEGGTIDFYRKGTMVAKVNQGGFEGIIYAAIRVEDKKIHVTTRHQKTGEEGTRVQTIRTLEANRLVLEDERGTSIMLQRAKLDN
jgi:hypothetical protein